MLPLVFQNEKDYDKIRASDRISILDLEQLAPDKPLTVRIQPREGSNKAWELQVRHSFTPEQIEYFKAGSALNLMASRKTQKAHVEMS